MTKKHRTLADLTKVSCEVCYACVNELRYHGVPWDVISQGLTAAQEKCERRADEERKRKHEQDQDRGGSGSGKP